MGKTFKDVKWDSKNSKSNVKHGKHNSGKHQADSTESGTIEYPQESDIVELPNNDNY